MTGCPNTMYQLIEATKDVIDDIVVGRRTMRQDAAAGETNVPIIHAWNFSPCDCIIIHQRNCSELHQIASIPNGTTLELQEPLAASFAAGATVEKVYGGQQVTTYIGDPPNIPTYPAITVDLVSRTQEPLAIQTFSDQYELILSVYVSKEDFDRSYRLLHDLTQIVEGSLFVTAFPLIEPYFETTLTADVSPDDTTIIIEDERVLGAFVDFMLDSDEQSTNHRVHAALGDGEFRLLQSVGTTYNAGDKVIRPLVHVYDAGVERIDYHDARQGATTLKVSTLTYTLRMARHRARR